MSQYDLRNAPQDTALDLNAPNQEMSVIKAVNRFYPEELSDQIRIEDQKKAFVSKIPESIANITEHINDYRLSAWNADQQKLIDIKDEENRVQEREFERTLKLGVANKVFDKRQQLMQTYTDALANRGDKSRYEALQEASVDYENPEDLQGTAAQAMWQEAFQSTSATFMSKAIQDDAADTKSMAAYNLDTITQEYYGNIQNGVTDETTGFTSFIKASLPGMSLLSEPEKLAYTADAYNKFGIGRAQYIKAAVASGDLELEEGKTYIKSMLAQGGKKQFDIQDKEGKTHPFTVAYTAQTQSTLYSILNDLAASGGSGQASSIANSFAEVIDYDSLIKNGTSDKLAAMSMEEYNHRYSLALKGIASLKDSAQKDKQTRELMETYANGLMFKQIQSLTRYNLSTTNGAQNVVSALRTAITKITSDLSGGYKGAWSDYSFSLNLPDGSIMDFSANAFLQSEDIKNSGIDLDNANKVYWHSVLSFLNKAYDNIKTGTAGELLWLTDATYKEKVSNIIPVLTSNNLLQGEGIDLHSSQKGEQLLVDIITDIDKRTSELGYGKQDLPPAVIDSLMETTYSPSNFKTKHERIIALQTIAKALADTGHLSDLTTYAYLNSKDNKNIEQVQEIFTALTLNNLYKTDPKRYSALNEVLFNRAADPDASNKQYTALDKNGDITASKNKILEELEIPKEHYTFYSDLFEVCALAVNNKTGSNNPARIKNKVKDIFKEIVDTNYIKMPYSKYKFFKYSSHLKQYDTPDKMKFLQKQLKDTHNIIKKEASRLQLGDRVSNISWYSDDSTHQIRLATGTGTEGFMIENPITGETNYFGIFNIPNDLLEDIMKTGNTDVIKTWTAQTFLTGMLATDNSAVKKVNGHIRFADSTNNIGKSEKIAIEGYPNKSVELYNIGQENKQTTLSGDKKHRTLQELYPQANLKRDSLSVFYVLSNPVKMREIINDTQDRLESEEVYVPSHPLLYVLGDYNRGVTSSDEVPYFEMYKHIEEEIGSGTSNINSILKKAQDKATYVGKVDQTSPAEGLTQAATGNENHQEIEKVNKKEGYNTKKPEGTITGGAAMIIDPDELGTKHTAPKALNKTYKPEEITSYANYAAAMFNIPRDIAHALIMQESGGKQYVKSHKGATGVMQLMPGTAKGLGVTDIKDAKQNIWGGMKYLNNMYKQFGTWPLALAAYNAGPAAVAKYKGIPPYKETQNYVKNICKKAGVDPTDKSYPITISMSTNKAKFIDPDTDQLSVSKMDSFIYTIQNNPCYKDKIIQIQTNRKELLEDKVEYSDFKKYRAMKTADGKPLFVASEFDGFKIQIKKEHSEGLNPVAISAIADDAYATQTPFIPTISRNKAEALISTYQDRYNNSRFNEDETFGLAKLTASEYEDYGLNITQINNPIMQARVLIQEFQRAQDLLGSERKALYALAGGNLIDNKGNLKNWKEIKADKESFFKDWYIRPSQDTKERDIINTRIAQYNAFYQNINGV